MPLPLDQSLAKLCRLSPQRLHRTTRRMRAELGGAEWKLALCLTAAMRQSSFLALGFKSLSQYAEYGLHLSGKKVRALLGVARALEHLPIMSQAFQTGKICWGKLRAIQSLVTPETETQWLEFAMKHNTDQVVRKVSLSPAAWKGQRAPQASLAGQPMATSEQVESLLAQPDTPDPPPGCRAAKPAPYDSAPYDSALCDNAPVNSTSCQVAGDDPPFQPPDRERPTPDPGRGDDSSLAGGANPTAVTAGTAKRPHQDGPSRSNSDPSPCAPAVGPFPGAPRTIRVVFELTPDQFAIYDRAETRVRAKLGRRAGRAEVLTHLAEANLQAGSSRSRAKHQIVIVKTEQGAWYDTSRGLLPANSTVLAKAESSQTAVRGYTRHHNDQVITARPPGDEQTASQNGAATSRTSEASPVPPTEQAVEVPNGGQRKPGHRVPVGAATLRELFARAGHRCEECGQAGLLEVHHKKRVSQGGGNDLQDLAAVCYDCHRGEHQHEFATKPQWRRARAPC